MGTNFRSVSYGRQAAAHVVQRKYTMTVDFLTIQSVRKSEQNITAKQNDNNIGMHVYLCFHEFYV